MNDIYYEQIKNNFYYGTFWDCKLVIDINTGYFNATKFCINGGKKFFKWSKLDKSQKLINYYRSQGFHHYEIKGGNNNDLIAKTTGTYVPFELFYDINNWIQLPRIIYTIGAVYIITTPILQQHNVFKIGYTKNFEEKLKIFNNDRHSLERYFPVAIYDTTNAKRLETAIHTKLKEYRSEGEFFKADITLITNAFINEECELRNLRFL